MSPQLCDFRCQWVAPEVSIWGRWETWGQVPNSNGRFLGTILATHPNLHLDDISPMVPKYQVISSKLLRVQREKIVFSTLFSVWFPACPLMEAAQRSDRCTEHDFRRGLRDLGLEVSNERYDVLLKVLEKVAMGHGPCSLVGWVPFSGWLLFLPTCFGHWCWVPCIWVAGEISGWTEL